MTSIPKSITLDPLTAAISKQASVELKTKESTLIRYLLYCFDNEPNVSLANIKQRLFEPTTRDVYLSEMNLTMHKFIEKQQPGVRVHSTARPGSQQKKTLSLLAPSGRRYTIGLSGIRVTNPEDIAFFKQQEAGSGFKVVDSRVEVEVEE